MAERKKLRDAELVLAREAEGEQEKQAQMRHLLASTAESLCAKMPAALSPCGWMTAETPRSHMCGKSSSSNCKGISLASAVPLLHRKHLSFSRTRRQGHNLTDPNYR
eukprot:TRINITY_DN4448_c0_g1_i2.p1 TRINITY_DN4448_c0_g1~~TRINITY_DN4448_c0_g1_i2.p1  ORF type:complete len:107 (+),score=17.04 TRINITY_DN4448_c0_g1_i2:367-687(+)